MKSQNIIIITIAILALLAAVTTATETKPRRWPKPTELEENKSEGYNPGWGAAYGCVEDPSTPPSPLPLPPGFSFPPGFPGIGGETLTSVKVSAKETKSISKCMSHSPKAKDCYAQILNSWVDKKLHLDTECCRMVVLMDDQCHDVVFGKFNSAFFPRLLQYSCHIKHRK